MRSRLASWQCVARSVLAWSLLGTGCWGSDRVPEAAIRPNIILLSIDTLRADHLGCYGHARDTSPNLDRFASQGLVFEQAMAPAPWTMPSHASLLTGRTPTGHGVRGFGQALPPRVATLASGLADAGYATAAVINLAAMRNLLRGFERTWILRPGEGDSEDVFAIAHDWLDAAPAPFFLFLHVYDLHAPYRPSPEFAAPFLEPYDGVATGGALQLQKFQLGKLELGPDDARHLRNLYDGDIRQQDARLGEFLGRLERAGQLDDSLVAIVSDHGEEFFEHGWLGHAHTLHQELIRVPLILVGAGVPRGGRIPEPVSLLDLAPTLLSIAGAPPLPTSDGVDLSPYWLEPDAAPPSRPIVSETNHWLGNKSRNLRRAVRHGRFTLHYDARSASYTLFDLQEDPGETRDLARRRPRVAAMLRPMLEPFIPRERPPRAPSVPGHLVEELRELGYLDAEAGEAPAD